MKLKKENKGITLVALVVTIIILIILAGISIAQLTGSGLFEKAKLAKEKSEKAQTEENTTLADYENQISNYNLNNQITSSRGSLGTLLWEGEWSNGSITVNVMLQKIEQVYFIDVKHIL